MAILSKRGYRCDIAPCTNSTQASVLHCCAARSVQCAAVTVARELIPAHDGRNWKSTLRPCYSPDETAPSIAARAPALCAGSCAAVQRMQGTKHALGTSDSHSIPRTTGCSRHVWLPYGRLLFACLRHCSSFCFHWHFVVCPLGHARHLIMVRHERLGRCCN